MSQEPTGPGITTVKLSIETKLLPDWFQAVQRVAARYCIKMKVIEKDTEHLVDIFLPEIAKPYFERDLATEWDRFVEARKLEGGWHR